MRRCCAISDQLNTSAGPTLPGGRDIGWRGGTSQRQAGPEWGRQTAVAGAQQSRPAARAGQRCGRPCELAEPRAAGPCPQRVRGRGEASPHTGRKPRWQQPCPGIQWQRAFSAAGCAARTTCSRRGGRSQAGGLPAQHRAAVRWRRAAPATPGGTHHVPPGALIYLAAYQRVLGLAAQVAGLSANLQGVQHRWRGAQVTPQAAKPDSTAEGWGELRSAKRAVHQSTNHQGGKPRAHGRDIGSTEQGASRAEGEASGRGRARRNLRPQQRPHAAHVVPPFAAARQGSGAARIQEVEGVRAGKTAW